MPPVSGIQFGHAVDYLSNLIIVFITNCIIYNFEEKKSGHNFHFNPTVVYSVMLSLVVFSCIFSYRYLTNGIYLKIILHKINKERKKNC